VIKAGEMLIESTEVEWDVEYDNQTWGTRNHIECTDEAEARAFANTLVNSRLITRTVLMTPWAEVAK
jgi:hypothetical protein